MHTELNSILSINHILTEENKEKVCLIEDVAKLLKSKTGELLSVQEFDTMYDLSVKELEIYSSQVFDAVRRTSNSIAVDWRNIGKD